MAKVLIGVVVAAIVVIVVFQFIDPHLSSNDNYGYQTSLVEKDNNKISVTITGEITREGTYTLDLGSNLGVLISAASNVTSNADELAYNIDYMLEDGMGFYIAPKFDYSDVCTMEPIVKVNINKADAEELEKISGVGATIANAIVSYRKEKGNYGRIEDIKNVNGIGNATFEKIKKQIVLKDK